MSQALADALMNIYASELEPGDIIVTPSGVNGPDIMLSPKVKRLIAFDFECKNVEKIALWSSITQAESHVKTSKRTPALVVSRNRMAQPWVCIPMDAFLKLLKPEKTDDQAT